MWQLKNISLIIFILVFFVSNLSDAKKARMKSLLGESSDSGPIDDTTTESEADMTTDADTGETSTDIAETSTEISEIFDLCGGFYGWFHAFCYVPNTENWPLSSCFFRWPSNQYFTSWVTLSNYFDMRYYFPLRCYKAETTARFVEYGVLAIAMDIIYKVVSGIFAIVNRAVWYYFYLHSQAFHAFDDDDDDITTTTMISAMSSSMSS